MHAILAKTGSLLALGSKRASGHREAKGSSAAASEGECGAGGRPGLPSCVGRLQGGSGQGVVFDNLAAASCAEQLGMS